MNEKLKATAARWADERRSTGYRTSSDGWNDAQQLADAMVAADLERRLADAQAESPGLVAARKRACHEIGDLFCWCVQNLDKFPPPTSTWLDDVKRRLANAPDWHDAPTGLGFWLWSRDMGIVRAEPADFRPDAEAWEAGPYFGPIPPQPKTEQQELREAAKIANSEIDSPPLDEPPVAQGTMQWQKPDRDGRAYVEGEGNAVLRVGLGMREGDPGWCFASPYGGAVPIGDKLVCYIPDPPPLGRD